MFAVVLEEDRHLTGVAQEHVTPEGRGVAAGAGYVGIDVGQLIDLSFEPEHGVAHRGERRSNRIGDLDENLASIGRGQKLLADITERHERDR